MSIGLQLYFYIILYYGIYYYIIQHLRFQFICLFIFSQAQKNKDVTSSIDTVIVPQQTVYEYKTLCATIYSTRVYSYFCE